MIRKSVLIDPGTLCGSHHNKSLENQRKNAGMLPSSRHQYCITRKSVDEEPLFLTAKRVTIGGREKLQIPTDPNTYSQMVGLR